MGNPIIISAFQSTHPQGVRLEVLRLAAQPWLISIHAPTRGATHIPLIVGFRLEISIHAPTRGATLFCQDCSDLQVIFQSTHPQGVRPGKLYNALAVEIFQSTHPQGVRLWFLVWLYIFIDISIHAPTRGATGADIEPVERLRFQSTHPQGVRPDGSRLIVPKY